VNDRIENLATSWDASPKATPCVGLVGAGQWGKHLARNFADLGALASISDLSPARAQETASAVGVPVRPWADVLADPECQAVAIAAPAVDHARLASAALRAGKHVFVEKPLALDPHEGEQVVGEAERRGLTLMVGHLLHYHPAFLRLSELVADGTLGRLQYLYSTRLNLGRFRREENILWSFAPHDISMILALVGEEPASVQATGSSYLHPDIPDVTITNLSFPNGVRGHVFVSWLHPYKEQRLVVVGSEAMAVFDDGQPWSGKLVLYRHRVDWRDGAPHPLRADAEAVPLEEAEPLRSECEHFLSAVASGARPRTDGREALGVLRVLSAAQRSMSPTTRAVDRARAHGDEAPFVHATSVVDPGAHIGGRTAIWHFSHVLAGSRIGAQCTLGQNVVVGPDVTIGDRCKIQNNVSVYKGVTLEDGVFCGPSCVFTNVLNPRAEVSRTEEFLPTLVKRGATIGANATVVCGVTLGEWSMVGAGAVVTHDVPAHALVVGVPARRVGWVSHDGEILDEGLACPRSGRKYRLVSPEQLEEIPG
jgi:predicted dehydrogenase/acetyltransferase-like isoleucine patch superfamily enzyme